MSDQRRQVPNSEGGTVKRQGKDRHGKWIALWPKSVDPRRRNVTPGIAYETQAEAEAALAKQVAAYNSNPSAFPDLTHPSNELDLEAITLPTTVKSRRPRRPRNHDDDRDGSVRRLRSGRWRAQWPRRIDLMEGNVDHNGLTFETEAEARAALRDAISDQRRYPDSFVFNVRDGDDEIRTVDVATQQFIDQNAHELAVKTVKEYRSIRRVVVCHPTKGIGSKTVRDLTSGGLKKWRTALTQEHGVTPAQAAHGWRFLRSVLSWEVEEERLTHNPALGQTQRRRKKKTAKLASPSRVPVPSWQQEMDIALNIADETRRLLYLVLLRCGPRIGEVAAIDADVLDPRVNVVPLTHQWVRGDGGVWVREPLKSGYEREMSVPPQLMRAILDFREHRWTDPPRGRKRVLFPHIAITGERRRGSTGIGVWTAAEYRRIVLLKARDAARVPRIRIKDLRMSAASNFHDAGFSEVQIQELLGHSLGSAVTRRHYIRPLRDRSTRRAKIAQDASLTPEKRLEALWDAWRDECGDPLADWRKKRNR